MDATETDQRPLYVEVAVAAPLRDALTYLWPESLKVAPDLGCRVRVPLGGRAVSGFIVAIDVRPPPGAAKPVQAVLEAIPALTPKTLALGRFVARHYCAPLGEALEALVPAAVRHDRRSRTEERVWLTDRKAAEEVLKARAKEPSFEARARVLRLFLEAPADALEGFARRELERMARVSQSPIRTLCKDGLLREAAVALESDLYSRLEVRPASRPIPTADQQKALDQLLPLLGTHEFAGALLHGVTGSGKTEVYLRLLEETLASGRGAILLVPEISLTPQTVERLLARLGKTIAVLHSNLSDGDRVQEWRRLRRGEVRVAVGPRSALFAPIESLGLILLDEEHETTFKQHQSPRYHARDVALERARLEGALLVLGSATPSLESEALVQAGVLTRVSMPIRVEGRPLPDIRVVDMRTEKPLGPNGLFSRVLIHQIGRSLEAGEQVVLFLNRRGFSTLVACKRCGYKATCEHCAVQLTHYRTSERLLCHHCGRESEAPTRCPDCASHELRFSGVGTEKVAEAAAAFFPGRRIERMDSDRLSRRGEAERIFQALKKGEIDILVGTQSLAKGFDIPNITLVGVISADTGLLIPDFRSSERTFQLLSQVAGRTGRGNKRGLVFIQTYSPDHPAIKAAATHNYAAFVQQELAFRKELHYPPHGHLARAVFEGQIDEQVAAASEHFQSEAKRTLEAHNLPHRLLGPAPCPLARLKDRWRRHLLLFTEDSETLTQALEHLPPLKHKSVRMLWDRDPVALS